jgi:hypothetical protein
MAELAVFDIAESQETGSQVNRMPGLGVRQFKSFLEECRWQPPWRNMADKCADYYDGNQSDNDTMRELERRGMGPLQRNIIHPLVNVVLGMEAKTRSDWRVSADDDVNQEVAEAESAKLHEVERETRADRACSDSYGGQIKAGLHWVEVSRSTDPYDYPHRAIPVHRREIWWDWRDTQADLSKARFLLRKRWFDVDQAGAYFPDSADLLRACIGDPNRYEMIAQKHSLDLGQSLEESRGLDLEDYEQWRSFDRHRIALYEVWYRVFVRGWVAKLPNGDVIEIDERNRVQMALIQRSAIRPWKAVYSKLRMSMWAGPHKLMDVECSKRYFPYVPFWGYREDRTAVPYGLVRAMLVPQDEVNARLQKMMWLLGAKRVEMDSDALDTALQSPQDMLDEIARPDAVVFLNPNRTNKQAFSVSDNLQVSDAQFKILQDAMQSAQQVVGVFNAMLGRESSTSSGLAINSLVEQGTTALAEINDNYRFARRLVGERLLYQVREDLIGQQIDVLVGEQGKKRTISLNHPVRVQHPQTGEMIQQVKNAVEGSKTRVALDDVPSTASYRQQQFTMLAEMTKGLPPNLQAVIAPFVMEASDLSTRRQMADALRKAMGTPTPRTPDEEKQMEAAATEAQQFAQQVQRQQALLELKERQAKVDKLNAEAQKALAEAKRDPNLQGAAQGQHAKLVADMQQKAQDDIDKLTAELMAVRMDSAKREQLLLGKLNETVVTLKANRGNQQAEQRKAEIEREIAKIEADKDVRVAQIEADSTKVVNSLTEQLVKLREELTTKVEKVATEAKKAEERAAARADKAEKAGAERAAKGAVGPREVKVMMQREPQPDRVVEIALPDGRKAVGTVKSKGTPKK